MSNEVWATTPVPCDPPALVVSLEALAIPNVRTYSVIGREGECAGVYAWRADAPVGEYQHIGLSAADVTKVRQAITAHVPPPPPPDPEVELDTAIQAATTLDQLKTALLGKGGRGGRVRAKRPQ